MPNPSGEVEYYKWWLKGLWAQAENSDFPLTHEQLKVAWGVASKATVNARLYRLVEEGYVEVSPNKKMFRFVSHE